MSDDLDERKKNLFKFSADVKKLVLNGKYQNINEALINEFYRRNGHEIFKTFADWKKEGFKVKKGMRAFILWSRPINSDDNKKFAVAYVFSNLQVEQNKVNNAA